MTKRQWSLLFSNYDLRALLDARLESINERVLAIDSDRFRTETDDLLAASIASQLVVSPIELLEDQISVSSDDAKVDVSHDFSRAISDRSLPFYVDGLVVTYHVPFIGDPQLLQCRPGTFTLNPPMAVVDASGELRFPYERADQDVSATKRDFERDLLAVKEWLAWIERDVRAFNASLESKVRQHVERRRQELRRTQAELEGLGYRIRTEATRRGVPPATVRGVSMGRYAQLERKGRRYDVALSFAGEDRQYVEAVADELVRLGVTVFYDRFEQVNLWGKDLAEHFAKVYSEDSHFVVIFASRAYAQKGWPNHEKQFALGRNLEGERGRILPVRLDDSQIPGVPPTIGYLDARVLTPAKLAELIRQKLDSESEERGVPDR